MLRLFVQALGVALALQLGACGTVQDTLLPSGPARTRTSGEGTPLPHTGQILIFQQAYDKAQANALLVISDPITYPAGSAAIQASYANFAATGLGLVRANCSEFFKNRGENQQTVNFLRDGVALLTGAATTIVGITGASTLAMTIIAASGTTLYAGIDTYTKNFLFGAENIEAVRTLVLNAVDAQTKKILAPGPWTFETAAGAIMDVQETCKPASIAAMTREAIRNGKVDAVGTDDALRQGQDAIIINTIAATVGFQTTPDDDLLATICWAATDRSLTAADNKYISQILPNPPFFKGPLDTTGSWPTTKITVATQCTRLSADARAVIQTKIAALKKSLDGDQAVPAPPLGGVGAGAGGGSSGGASVGATVVTAPTRHFTIKVR
jgi:hypothetical protein